MRGGHPWRTLAQMWSKVLFCRVHSVHSQKNEDVCIDSQCSCTAMSYVFVFSRHVNRAVPYVRMPRKHSKHVDLVHLRSVGDGEVLLRFAASFKSLTPCDLSLNSLTADYFREILAPRLLDLSLMTTSDRAFQIHPAPVCVRPLLPLPAGPLSLSPTLVTGPSWFHGGSADRRENCGVVWGSSQIAPRNWLMLKL